MISPQRLKEFGFDDAAKFPQLLLNHAVTISLPSAVAHNVGPVTVIIDRGLAVPVQMPGVPNGMIIKSDGTMVYVGHRDPLDFASLLQASFVRDIAYDVRVEAYNIMRRAVELDPVLNGIWQEIQSQWVKWYPPAFKEIERQSAGQFLNVQSALQGLEELIRKFIDQTAQTGFMPVRIIVQTAEELEKGWQGEEFPADETTNGRVLSLGPKQYVRENLLPKLKKILSNPVFFSQSAFQLYYEQRVVPAMKLVVVPPTGAPSEDFARGIDL